MKFTSFENGFRSELANRQFARTAMSILADRGPRLDSGPFWVAYHRLEELNAPRFAAAAERMGVSIGAQRLARARGWAAGHTPARLLPELLRFAYPRTVEYAADLRRLRDAGPESERAFLEYMVRQEDLQVRMMHAVLLKEYDQVTAAVQEFLARET